MSKTASITLPAARYRHDRVLFELVEDGTTVTCSVSKTAIQEASGGRPNLPDAVLAAFALLRDRIEAVALAKIRARPAEAGGIVHVWSGDLDDEPEPEPREAELRLAG